MKMDSFEEIEAFVAIGDYVAQENCNISLRCGQQVQVCVRERECVRMYVCICLCTCASMCGWVG